ncbi:MAG TPA: uL30 family ribosomal protein [Patescibacteria group bacterium]|nr:uL30 family ribosomal protein [Patescibacteria group bacterium]
MIAIIRIAGRVGIRNNAVETFNRLNLKRKYSCIVFTNPTNQERGMLERIKDMVAYGTINKETYDELVKKRASKIKNVFRLHPPRGGVKSTKMHYPKGVLGNNHEDINKLIVRML